MMKCLSCRDGEPLGFDFQIAFQPIVHFGESRVWAYEALVRGVAGEPAYTVLDQVTEANRYKFDQACRVKAIESASERFYAPHLRLSINFMPNAVYEPSACIKASINAANRTGFDLARIIFEFTENEPMRDTGHVTNIIAAYKEFGFQTALDDFGAGYAGLGLLCRIQPDLIKIDMDVLRGLERSAPRRAIVRGIFTIAQELGIAVLAEGVETHAELDVLRDMGVELFQGYLFGMPTLGPLPQIEGVFA
jgi:EAL domain-containing protein (putative c-di-GMP-specific phosphodiesterase class I)